MLPYLKDGNWDAGMVAGLKATCQRLDGSMENDALSDSSDGGSFDFILAILCFMAIGGGLAFFSARKQSRCPKCGKHQLQRGGSTVVSRINGVKTEDVTYICRNCGHTIIRRQQSYDSDYHHRGGGGGGPFIGGFGGGSFGGGGGGGITITPVAFIVIENGKCRMMQINNYTSSADRAIAMIPELVDKVTELLKPENKEETAQENNAE